MSISVARALTSGVTATLTILRMASGSVCESGPTTKKEMITSSSESVKANKAPDMDSRPNSGNRYLAKSNYFICP